MGPGSVFNACIDKRLFSMRAVHSYLIAINTAISGGKFRGVWAAIKPNKSDLLSGERNSGRPGLAPENSKFPNPCC